MTSPRSTESSTEMDHLSLEGKVKVGKPMVKGREDNKDWKFRDHGMEAMSSADEGSDETRG